MGDLHFMRPGMLTLAIGDLHLGIGAGLRGTDRRYDAVHVVLHEQPPRIS